MSDDPTQQRPPSESDFHTQQPTQERAQPSIVPDSSPSSTKPWKKWGLASLVLLIATALLFFSFFLPWFAWNVSWSCSGSDCQAVTLSVKTHPLVSSGFSVASNGVFLMSASATVDDRAVIPVATASFSSFPFLWLVLVISIVLFLSQILMNLFKTSARWEPPFTLIITAVALSVEIFYMQSAFWLSGSFVIFPGTPSNPIAVYAPIFPGTPIAPRFYFDIYATLHVSSTTDATLHLSPGPSFGSWLGLLATLVVGGVAVVRVASQQPPPHGHPQLQYVSVWPRAGAVIIDSILLSVVSAFPIFFDIFFGAGPIVPIYSVVSAFLGSIFVDTVFFTWGLILTGGLLLWLILFYGYFIVMEAMWGVTLGKLLFRLRVVKTDGSPMSWSASVIRNLLRIVDGLPASYTIGAILIWNSPLRQRLGDRAAKTVVVRRSLFS